MATESTILFVDIVGYSAQVNRDQRSLVLELTRAFTDSFLGGLLEKDSQAGVVLATGDGFVAALFQKGIQEHPEQVVDCAVEIRKAMEARAKLRIGLNQGPGYRYSDFNARNLKDAISKENNVAGASINFAQRVMSLGDPGDILATEQFAKHLREAAVERADDFIDVGEVQVKHGERLKVFKYARTPLDQRTRPKRIRDYETAKRQVVYALEQIHKQFLKTASASGKDAQLRTTLLPFNKRREKLTVSAFRCGHGLRHDDPPCPIMFDLNEGPGTAFARNEAGYALLPHPKDANYYQEVQKLLGIPEHKARLFHRPSLAYLYLPVSVEGDGNPPFGVISIDAMVPLLSATTSQKVQALGQPERQWRARLARANGGIQQWRTALASAWITLSRYFEG